MVRQPRPGVFDFSLLPKELPASPAKSALPAAAPAPVRVDSGSLARELAHRERVAEARLAQERVQGFLEAALARDRVSSGQIEPRWLDLEHDLGARFSATEALVQVGSATMTRKEAVRAHFDSLVAQIFGSPGRVERGSLPRGEYAERGPAGEPESIYRNGLAAQQSRALLNAWESPAAWRRTDLELTLSPSGKVESVRVVSSCGSSRLDQRAVDTIQRVARGRVHSGKRTVTRWRFESAYAVNPPQLIGFRFDATGHIDKGARGIGRYVADPLYLIGGNLQTRVSLLSFQEVRR